MTDDPHQFRPGDQPTPFSADEIRRGCPPGRTVRTLVVRAGQEPYVHVTRFSTGDGDGADQELWTETPDGIDRDSTNSRLCVWPRSGKSRSPSPTTTG